MKPIIKLLSRKVTEYFKNEENRKDFEAWYERRTGKKYQWKTGTPK